MAAEAQLEKYLVARCKELGILTYKFSSPSHRGVPDRILLYEGETWFVELKAPNGRLTALQEREIERLNAAGFNASCVWKRQGVEDILNKLLSSRLDRAKSLFLKAANEAIRENSRRYV